MTTSPLQAQPATRVMEAQPTLPPATLAPGAMLLPMVSPALATRSSEWAPKHNVTIYEKQTCLLLRKTCAEAFAFLPTGASFNVESPHTQLQPRHASHRVIHAQHVACHTSSTAHSMVSHVTHHTSHATRHTSHVKRTANHRRDRTRPRWAPLTLAEVDSEGKTQTSEITEPDNSNNSDLSV
jgi:hypothetical protein